MSVLTSQNPTSEVRPAGAGFQATDQWSLIVAVKDETVLHDTLLRSPDIGSRCQVIPRKDFSSAAKAYNTGMAEAAHEILVFAHTDVYFPEGWLQGLAQALARIEATDPNWGAVGVCGVSSAGAIAGHVYSTGSSVMFGQPFDGAIEAQSLDEMVLILRRSAGLRFDEGVPGFHLYGTDICMEARRKGLKNYIVSAFCIHNSNGIGTLPPSFFDACGYLRKKWWSELPIRTCCTEISRTQLPLVGKTRAALRQFLGVRRMGTRSSDPEKLYRQISQRPDASPRS